MTDKCEERDGALSSLNMAIDVLNRAKEASIVTPAQTALTSAGALLTIIGDSMTSEVDYVELGLTCASVCEALGRGTDRKRADQLNQSVLEVVERQWYDRDLEACHKAG